MTTPRPQVQPQGMCVCEPADNGSWLVMTPDGCVVERSSRASAERFCKAWFKTHSDPAKVGVGTIEWRGK